MHIDIDISHQRLQLRDGAGAVRMDVPISSGVKGVGEVKGSGCTPRGLHVIRAKVGAGVPERGVFVSRRFTGEVYGPDLARYYPQRDWVLTRILWLSGLEPGRNRLGPVDTFRRLIYLHGCPDELPMGTPLSHGCIRLRNADILALFEQVPVGTQVHIRD
ncbi:L,D-transpeptidase [Pyxidicoccus parkwayensis]|uniref:L,D-transpeptidase n=1 Tax=Pyxidicoccus parkwayensis TaxID=2813578 RepID=A0ABX7NVU9_9BACT|nr:L,D-transpeptidase [Pyxidicoccus parkwaysis]QSQ23066.1 L,D-transpeptidase [Pyxidicoccus parkwaysis]